MNKKWRIRFQIRDILRKGVETCGDSGLQDSLNIILRKSAVTSGIWADWVKFLWEGFCFGFERYSLLRSLVNFHISFNVRLVVQYSGLQGLSKSYPEIQDIQGIFRVFLFWASQTVKHHSDCRANILTASRNEFGKVSWIKLIDCVDNFCSNSLEKWYPENEFQGILSKTFRWCTGARMTFVLDLNGTTCLYQS